MKKVMKNEINYKKEINFKEEKMKFKNAGNFFFSLVTFALLLSGCASDKPPRSYVQANVVDKGYFQGEWWYSTKVIDVNYPFEGMTYPGDAAMDYSGGGFTVSRIRWVIDENYLYAFRSYELVQGANTGATDPKSPYGAPAEGYIGEPVAAYKILSHFDIKRQYNPTTGEEYNIIEENTYDRKWYERQYMRVDWSQNLMVSWMVNSAELYSDAGILKKEPVPMFVQDYSQWENYFPASWKPRFAFADPDYDTRHNVHFTDEYNPGELYFMSFVSQAIFTPGVVPDPYTGEPVPWCMSVYVDAPICVSNLVTMRSSFLKVSPKHQFEPTYYPNKTHFDHFGAFRVERWTYDKIEGDNPGEDFSFGETQFLGYYASKFNIWKEYYDDNGNLIPYERREIRPIVYHISKETPRWLIRPAFEFMSEWNEVLMNMVRELKNQGSTSRTYKNVRDWSKKPDPALRDINCWFGAVTESGESEELPDPMAVDENGKPLREITSWDDFKNENRLAMFYDPNYSFTSPDGRTITPGNECLIQIHVNTCDKPLEAFDPDTRRIIQNYMNENSIQSIDDISDDELYSLGIECEERGDMRYKLISYIQLPGAPFLGVTSIQSDPITGEIIAGDSNIAAWDLHRYRVRAFDEIDLTTGDISELEFITGEDVKSYYEKQGYSLPAPEPIIPNWLQAQDRVKVIGGVSREGIQLNMRRAMGRLAKLKGTTGKQNLLTYRRELLHGTDIERTLLDNDDSMLAAGMIKKTDDGAPRPVDAIIESVSPFKVTAFDIFKHDMEKFQKFSRNNVEIPSFFVDFSVQNFVEQHQDWPRTNQIFKIEQILYKETLIHEFGHTLNLRHNMRGTADPWNYPEPYFEIVSKYPKPDIAQFDRNNDTMLDSEEAQAYRTALNDVQTQRELNTDPETKHWGSIDAWMTSSMMDYTGQWYNRVIPYGHFIDPYDKAAIFFSYGNLVEVYDNTKEHLLKHCKDPSSGLNNDCITPDKVASGRVGKVYWTYYGGGESCSSDEDCPYSAGGTKSNELKQNQITQTCRSGICSNFYDDMDRTFTGDRPDYVARRYKFCTDERRTDIGMDDSQCNVFDEGASYREIVANMRQTYHRKYLFNNFRRYRGDYDFYTYYEAIAGRFFLQPVKIFQDMVYRYATEPGYKDDDGPFGFYDQYLASVDLLNFYMEVMGYPDVGAYQFKSHKNIYDQYKEDPTKCLPGNQYCIRVDLGTGKYNYSRYQRGLNGVYRVEFFGTIYDKMFAQQVLLLRGLAFNYSFDEAFYVNFYDVFPYEITELLRGQIANESDKWKPRVVDIDSESKNPILQYPTLYRGNCLPEEMIPDEANPGYYTCMTDPMAPWAGKPALEDYGNFYLRMYGLIYGLSDLPVYFDTQPQDMLHVYRVGSLFDAQIPKCECDPDCECTCNTTPGTCDAGCSCDPDCVSECTCNTNSTCENAVEGRDYVTFTSERTHNTYLAFQVSNQMSAYVDQNGNRIPMKNGGSIMFDVIKKCKQYQQDVQNWRTCLQSGNPAPCGFMSIAELREAYDYEFSELDNFEGMLNYAIELQQMFGISSWMGY